MPYVFVALVSVFAGAYAYFRGSDAFFSRLFYKAAASVMLILVAVSARRIVAIEPYYTLILIGLCFALAGNVLYCFTGMSRSYLIAGMAGFLCMHLLYIIAFWTIAAPGWYDAAFFALLIGIGVLAFKARGIKLQGRSSGIYVYAVVLCAMTARAFSMLFAQKASPAFSVCAAAGGLLIALSEMLRGFERFSKVFGRIAGIFSTAAYYAGQTLVALTVML